MPQQVRSAVERLWKENPCVCVCVSARPWTFDGVQELTLGLNWPYTDRYTKGTAVCSLADSFAFEIVQPHLNTYAAAANSHARPNAHWAAIWCAICSTTWSVAMVSDGGPSPPQGVGRSTDMRATRANAVMVVFHLTPHCGVNVKKKNSKWQHVDMLQEHCGRIGRYANKSQTKRKQGANEPQTERHTLGAKCGQSVGMACTRCGQKCRVQKHCGQTCEQMYRQRAGKAKKRHMCTAGTVQAHCRHGANPNVAQVWCVCVVRVG